MKTLSELSHEHAVASVEDFAVALDRAEQFTALFGALATASRAQREAELLALQYRDLFLPLEPGDLLVGRVRYPLIGFSPQQMGLGYFCGQEALAEGAQRFPLLADRAVALQAEWVGRTTEEHCRATLPKAAAQHLPSDAWFTESGVGFPLYRIGGTTLDYGRLVARGLDGLETETGGTEFAHVVPLLRATIDRYVAQTADPDIIATLRAIRHSPPRTYREAVQLIWLYALHAGSWNYGRLDIVLGPFLTRDAEGSASRQDEALDLTCSWWRLMQAYACQYDHRVFIGGRGRPDEAAADKFALLAIEATRRTRLNHPQLSMRFYEGQNPELWERALDAIGEGCTFPMLYNDDVNVSAVAHAFRVPESQAVHYTPFGCGEYVLGHFGIGSPNGVINLLKALEVALHGGMDPLTGRRLASVPSADALIDFAAVWQAYAAVVDPIVGALAMHQANAYRVAAGEAPFGFISALISDCTQRRRSAVGGGAVHLGGTLETYGNTNAADSLHVIEELVFKRREVSLPELVAAMDANFAGCEHLLAKCRAVAKYGNDEGTADAMVTRVHQHICLTTRAQADRVGLDSFLVVVINNWANTVLGKKTGASAEGRLAGQPMANGNNPSSGSDQSGVTAFLNSLVRLDPSIHAGAVQNMKFTKDWFGAMRPKFDALLRTYFSNGGTQAMITVVSRDELEAALREPEKWGHLVVRVGGFSIRFIELPREAQLEVLARTLN